MSIFKFAATSLVAVSFATASLAGGNTAPEVEAVVEEVIEAAGGSSASSGGGSTGILLPLLGLAAVAALISSNKS